MARWSAPARSAGAGDAAARTVIGRLEMRQRAARKAIEEGKTGFDIIEYEVFVVQSNV